MVGATGVGVCGVGVTGPRVGLADGGTSVADGDGAGSGGVGGEGLKIIARRLLPIRATIMGTITFSIHH